MSKEHVRLGPQESLELERARDGDKEAFSRLYTLAGVILAAGRQLPPDLAAFMGERLKTIGKALEAKDSRKELPEAVAPGVKRGRPAKRVDMLSEIAKAANDLHRPDSRMLKKQVLIALNEKYGTAATLASLKTKTHVVKRPKKQ